MAVIDRAAGWRFTRARLNCERARVGNQVSAQANIMAGDTVPEAMLAAYAAPAEGSPPS